MHAAVSSLPLPLLHSSPDASPAHLSMCHLTNNVFALLQDNATLYMMVENTTDPGVASLVQLLQSQLGVGAASS